MNDFAGYGYCGECGKECEVYGEVISWDYSPTHCAPKGGTHYEGIDFNSRCHDAIAYVNEGLTVEFDNDDCESDY